MHNNNTKKPLPFALLDMQGRPLEVDLSGWDESMDMPLVPPRQASLPLIHDWASIVGDTSDDEDAPSTSALGVLGRGASFSKGTRLARTSSTNYSRRTLLANIPEQHSFVPTSPLRRLDRPLSRGSDSRSPPADPPEPAAPAPTVTFDPTPRPPRPPRASLETSAPEPPTPSAPPPLPPVHRVSPESSSVHAVVSTVSLELAHADPHVGPRGGRGRPRGGANVYPPFGSSRELAGAGGSRPSAVRSQSPDSQLDLTLNAEGLGIGGSYTHGSVFQKLPRHRPTSVFHSTRMPPGRPRPHSAQADVFSAAIADLQTESRVTFHNDATHLALEFSTHGRGSLRASAEAVKARNRKLKGIMQRARPGGSVPLQQAGGAEGRRKGEGGGGGHRALAVRPRPAKLLTAPRILESSEKSEYKLVTLCLMRDHQLTGADPADLSRFTELRALDLDENYFEDLGALTELQFLRELHLGANALTSLQPLDPEDTFLMLEVLDVGYNLLDGDSVMTLSQLPSLKHLTISGNDLSDLPSRLGPFPCLEVLAANGCALPSHCLRTLAALPRLRELYLCNNAVQTISRRTAREGHFRMLEYLDLSANRIEEVTQAAPLVLLPRIKTVILTGNPFRSAPDSLAGQVEEASKALLQQISAQSDVAGFLQVERQSLGSLAGALSIADPGSFRSRASAALGPGGVRAPLSKQSSARSMLSAKPVRELMIFSDQDFAKYQRQTFEKLAAAEVGETAKRDPVRVISSLKLRTKSIALAEEEPLDSRDGPAAATAPAPLIRERSFLMGTSHLPSRKSDRAQKPSIVGPVLAHHAASNAASLQTHQDQMDFRPASRRDGRAAHQIDADVFDPMRHERIVAAFEQTLMQMAGEGFTAFGEEMDHGLPYGHGGAEVGLHSVDEGDPAAECGSTASGGGASGGTVGGGRGEGEAAEGEAEAEGDAPPRRERNDDSEDDSMFGSDDTPLLTSAFGDGPMPEDLLAEEDYELLDQLAGVTARSMSMGSKRARSVADAHGPRSLFDVDPDSDQDGVGSDSDSGVGLPYVKPKSASDAASRPRGEMFFAAAPAVAVEGTQFLLRPGGGSRSNLPIVQPPSSSSSDSGEDLRPPPPPVLVSRASLPAADPPLLPLILGAGLGPDTSTLSSQVARGIARRISNTTAGGASSAGPSSAGPAALQEVKSTIHERFTEIIQSEQQYLALQQDPASGGTPTSSRARVSVDVTGGSARFSPGPGSGPLAARRRSTDAGRPSADGRPLPPTRRSRDAPGDTGGDGDGVRLPGEASGLATPSERRAALAAGTRSRAVSFKVSGLGEDPLTEPEDEGASKGAGSEASLSEGEGGGRMGLEGVGEDGVDGDLDEDGNSEAPAGGSPGEGPDAPLDRARVRKMSIMKSPGAISRKQSVSFGGHLELQSEAETKLPVHEALELMIMADDELEAVELPRDKVYHLMREALSRSDRLKPIFEDAPTTRRNIGPDLLPQLPVILSPSKSRGVDSILSRMVDLLAETRHHCTEATRYEAMGPGLTAEGQHGGR